MNKIKLFINNMKNPSFRKDFSYVVTNTTLYKEPFNNIINFLQTDFIPMFIMSCGALGFLLAFTVFIFQEDYLIFKLFFKLSASAACLIFIAEIYIQYSHILDILLKYNTLYSHNVNIFSLNIHHQENDEKNLYIKFLSHRKDCPAISISKFYNFKENFHPLSYYDCFQDDNLVKSVKLIYDNEIEHYAESTFIKNLLLELNPTACQLLILEKQCPEYDDFFIHHPNYLEPASMVLKHIEENQND